MSQERTYAGESLAIRTGRRRQALLDAGLEVFGTIGYRKATVKGLCKQAQLADRYFYESFETLEDLLVATYEEQVRGLRAHVMAAFAGVPADASSLTVVEACLRAVLDGIKDVRVARLVWLEGVGVSPRVDKVHGATLSEFASLLVTLAKVKEPQWALDRDTERMLGLTLVGGINEGIQQWLMDPVDGELETLVTANLIVFEGVIAVLAQRHRSAPAQA